MFINCSVESMKYELENVKKIDYFELKIIMANKIRKILNINELCRIRANTASNRPFVFSNHQTINQYERKNIILKDGNECVIDSRENNF